METLFVLKRKDIRVMLPFGVKERIPFDRIHVRQGDALAVWLVRKRMCTNHFFEILPGHILLEASAQATICYAKAVNPALKNQYPLLKDFEGHLSDIIMTGDQLQFLISDFYVVGHDGSANVKVYLDGVEVGSFRIWFKILSERGFQRLRENKRKRKLEVSRAA